MTTAETDMLVQLVRAKHSCLVQLRDIGRQQLDLIDQGNIPGLLALLSAKQRPLMDLQRIERALDPFRVQDPERRPWRTAADRAACAEQLRQCESLLAEIVAQEKQCETIMTQQRDEAAARLHKFRTVSQAHGAYAAASRVQFHQLDVSSER
jgi:hypothetical protein